MSLPIYILAGGRSSRMGTEKGLMEIAGKAMVQYVIDNVISLSNQITIISSNEAYEPLGYRMIRDDVVGFGPAQGVITALTDCSASHCLLLTCDMPCLQIQQLEQLMHAHAEVEITCFAKDFFYPFPGIYATSILDKWQQILTGGTNKMQSLIANFQFKSLPITIEDVFLNVNTPADILQAAEILKG